jgi:phosphonate metabolism protein PhnN/1,5-bisphosphokinase (PRPP-forming)
VSGTEAIAPFDRPRRGTLVLAVGPSGAGKDSLIAGARLALAADRNFVFPRRFITRAADAGGEDHVALTREAFAQRRADSGFLLSWTAHGLDYGIPADLTTALDEGRTVVVNGSRAVIGEARDRYQPLVVIEVTAPPEILASRLAARGRESPAEIAARLSRAVAERPAGPETVRLCNDGTLDVAIAGFIALLRSARDHVAAPPKG